MLSNENDNNTTTKNQDKNTDNRMLKDISVTSNQSLRDTFLLMSLGDNSLGSVPDEWSENLTGGVGTALYR